MAGHPFDRPSLYSGPHAGVLRARHGRLPRRAPGAFDRMGVADAEIRQPVGVSPVPRRRGPDDHLADFRQFRSCLAKKITITPPKSFDWTDRCTCRRAMGITGVCRSAMGIAGGYGA